MKYAGIVLRNSKNSLTSVAAAPVFDALLSGGVFVDEIEVLAYDAPSKVSSALLRLSTECDGVFLVCAHALIASARDAVAVAAEGTFTEENILETGDCLSAVLPEGERGAQIVKTQVVPRIDKRRHKSYARVVLCTCSAPRDVIQTAVKQAEEAGGGKLSLHATEEYGCARIEVIYDQETPKMVADEVVRILATALKDYLYAMEDMTLAERLVSALKLHRLRISTAESFTAGGVGRAIVQVPGASAVFFEGINAYDNKAKRERLGVGEFTLMGKGAVSDEVAYEMAAGLLKQGNCDVAIATTGIAGPDADGTNKPVGLCYIAAGTREKVRVFRFRLSGDRETVTRTAINLALFLAYREIS